MFAQFREELDTKSNVKKEDRVVITGLLSNESAPTTFEDKKNG
jgi:hypothetical protein